MKPLKKFIMMQFVQTSYVESKKSDTEFAAWVSEQIGEKVSFAMIRQARSVLSIKNNAAPPLSPSLSHLLGELRAYFGGFARPNTDQKEFIRLLDKELP